MCIMMVDFILIFLLLSKLKLALQIAVDICKAPIEDALISLWTIEKNLSDS